MAYRHARSHHRVLDRALSRVRRGLRRGEGLGGAAARCGLQRRRVGLRHMARYRETAARLRCAGRGVDSGWPRVRARVRVRVRARGATACAVRWAGPRTHLPRISPLPGAPLLITSYNADEAEADEEELGAMDVANPYPYPNPNPNPDPNPDPNPNPNQVPWAWRGRGRPAATHGAPSWPSRAGVTSRPSTRTAGRSAATPVGLPRSRSSPQLGREFVE